MPCGVYPITFKPGGAARLRGSACDRGAGERLEAAFVTATADWMAGLGVHLLLIRRDGPLPVAAKTAGQAVAVAIRVDPPRSSPGLHLRVDRAHPLAQPGLDRHPCRVLAHPVPLIASSAGHLFYTSWERNLRALSLVLG